MRAATASAATYIYDVPDLVERPLKAVKKATTIDVLLPSQFTSDRPKLYSEGRGSGRSYRFEIGAIRRCGGANACFIASFRAKRGGKPSNPRKVTLRGRHGYFKPLRCGASCAPPSIQWVKNGSSTRSRPTSAPSAPSAACSSGSPTRRSREARARA